MDWSSCPEVESVNDRMSGAWVIKGTRVLADAIVENAAEGFTADQISKELYPTVSVAAVLCVLMFASAKPYAINPA